MKRELKWIFLRLRFSLVSGKGAPVSRTLHVRGRFEREVTRTDTGDVETDILLFVRGDDPYSSQQLWFYTPTYVLVELSILRDVTFTGNNEKSFIFV